jgi:PAS domain S-box-containing protein
MVHLSRSRLFDSAWVRYAAAAALAFAAMAVHMALEPLQTLTVIFLGAVAVAARWLGFGPALVTTFVSVVLLDWYFLSPAMFFWSEPAGRVRLLAFVMVAVLIASVARQRSIAEAVAHRFGREKQDTLDALADREERLRIGLTAAGMGTWRWEIDSDHDMRDASYNAMLGLPARESIQPATDFFDRVHPEDRARVRDAVERALHQGEEYDVDFRMRRADGSYIWVHDKAKVFRDADGKPLYMTGAVIDITDRKIAQEELRASREKFKRLFDTNMIGICFWTVDGKILEANDEFLRIVGMSRMEFENRGFIDWRKITPSEWKEADDRAIAETQQRGASSVWEKEYIRGDGTRVPVVLGIAFLSGSTFDGISFVMDITERKQAEKALLKQEKLASAGRLAATIAHEINNPLEAVTNLLYLVRQDPSVTAHLQPMLQLADEELQRVTHTAKQTLGFYRETTSPRDVDLVKAVEDVLSVYARKLEHRRIEVKTDFRARPTVHAFGGELRQIFSNVVNNAADAMPSGGVLRVRVAHDGGGTVRVTIADRGTGIDKGQIAHIFEPFFTTKRDVGTGLGLWVTKELVEKHGGKIALRSSTDPRYHGTVFAITLPENHTKRTRATA